MSERHRRKRGSFLISALIFVAKFKVRKLEFLHLLFLQLLLLQLMFPTVDRCLSLQIIFRLILLHTTVFDTLIKHSFISHLNKIDSLAIFMLNLREDLVRGSIQEEFFGNFGLINDILVRFLETLHASCHRVIISVIIFWLCVSRLVGCIDDKHLLSLLLLMNVQSYWLKILFCSFDNWIAIFKPFVYRTIETNDSLLSSHIIFFSKLIIPLELCPSSLC